MTRFGSRFSRRRDTELVEANEAHMRAYCAVPGCQALGVVSHAHGEAEEPIWYCPTHWRDSSAPPEPPAEGARVDWRDRMRDGGERWLSERIRTELGQSPGSTDTRLWLLTAARRLAARQRQPTRSATAPTGPGCKDTTES